MFWSIALFCNLNWFVTEQNKKFTVLSWLSSALLWQKCIYWITLRCPLFGLANQLTHPSRRNDAVAGGSDSLSSPTSSSSACVHKEVFIEPVSWMKEEIMQTEGKLNCPQCSKKIGTFSWFGTKKTNAMCFLSGHVYKITHSGGAIFLFACIVEKAQKYRCWLKVVI